MCVSRGCSENHGELSKGCVPLGTYRVEKTRGLIDGMGTVGLAETNGHNGSIEDH